MVQSKALSSQWVTLLIGDAIVTEREGFGIDRGTLRHNRNLGNDLSSAFQVVELKPPRLENKISGEAH